MEPSHGVARSIILYRRRAIPEPVAKRVTAIYDRVVSSFDEYPLEVTQTSWPTACQHHNLDGNLEYTYRTVTEWAEEYGCQLSPFFTVRKRYSPAHERYTDCLWFPVCALALYEYESLEAVFPHRRDSTTQTIEDGIDWLESSVLVGRSHPWPDPAPSDSVRISQE